MSSELKIRPNTIIDWIKRVQDYEAQYEEYRHNPKITFFLKLENRLNSDRRLRNLRQFRNKKSLLLISRLLKKKSWRGNDYYYRDVCNDVRR